MKIALPFECLSESSDAHSLSPQQRRAAAAQLYGFVATTLAAHPEQAKKQNTYKSTATRRALLVFQGDLALPETEPAYAMMAIGTGTDGSLYPELVYRYEIGTYGVNYGIEEADVVTRRLVCFGPYLKVAAERIKNAAAGEPNIPDWPENLNFEPVPVGLPEMQNVTADLGKLVAAAANSDDNGLRLMSWPQYVDMVARDMFPEDYI